MSWPEFIRGRLQESDGAENRVYSFTAVPETETISIEPDWPTTS